ncbi:MAG: hypothetical protein FWF70_08195 [Bacteroidetes bacterium]|nr:hypothetical protein [Bacteroidota bacterium]
MSNETSNFTLYAKADVQTGFEITTATGETIELDYPCRVYYVNITDETDSKYLIVKESIGNILEVNVKNDSGPNDLQQWRLVTKNSWFTYTLSNTLCQWAPLSYYFPRLILINSSEELEQNIKCAEGIYPKVDFSKYTLLWATGVNDYGVYYINTQLTKTGEKTYNFDVELLGKGTTALTPWIGKILVAKLPANAVVSLNVHIY